MSILTICVGALLVWNAVYCGWKLAADFRHSNSGRGVLGILALAGSASPLVIGLIVSLHGS
jgi:hypothetical protein